jgi:hypothetical protein
MLDNTVSLSVEVSWFISFVISVYLRQKKPNSGPSIKKTYHAQHLSDSDVTARYTNSSSGGTHWQAAATGVAASHRNLDPTRSRSRYPGRAGRVTSARRCSWPGPDAPSAGRTGPAAAGVSNNTVTQFGSLRPLRASQAGPAPPGPRPGGS